MAKNHSSSVSKISKKYKDFRFLSAVFIPCYYCGRPLDREHATTEHIKPLVSGKDNTKENLAICCVRCNNNHSAILSCNLNLEKSPETKRNIRTISKYRLMLSERERFWSSFNSFTVFNFLEQERSFGNEDISTYYNAAYYYSGTYTLDELSLNEREKGLILSRFYIAFP
jgi:hypothetical protein